MKQVPGPVMSAAPGGGASNLQYASVCPSWKKKTGPHRWKEAKQSLFPGLFLSRGAKKPWGIGEEYEYEYDRVARRSEA